MLLTLCFHTAGLGKSVLGFPPNVLCRGKGERVHICTNHDNWYLSVRQPEEEWKNKVYPDRTLSGRCLNTSQWTGICNAPLVLCIMFRWLNFVWFERLRKSCCVRFQSKWGMILSECISLKAVLWKVQFRSYICVSGGVICFVTCMWLDFDV